MTALKKNELKAVDYGEIVSSWKQLHGLKLIEAVVQLDRGLKICVTSSFGAESALLLDLVAQVAVSTPVVFVDTGRLFPETLKYRDHLVDHFGLTDIRTLSAPKQLIANMDPDQTLYDTDPDACCQVRKVMPYSLALSEFDVLVGGRKRHHGYIRSQIETAEIAGPHIKVNPLAHYTPEDIETAFVDRNLPRHPLVEQGYSSIGCAPCTHKSCSSQGARAGRWSGKDKTECGIHMHENLIFESLDGSSL